VVAPQLGRMPPALEAKPVQYDDLDYVFDAFNILTRGRKPKEPIQVDQIIAYAKAFLIEDLEAFIVLIQAADTAYLSHRHEGE